MYGMSALSQKINDLTNNNLVNLLTVSEKFHKQLANISLMNGGNTNDAALLDRVAANLPDNFFLYVPTYQSGTPGEPGVRLLPHCIASNKARYYFVMPQSARKDPEKKD